MKVKEPDNMCVICGNTIPEGRQHCPICGASEGDFFEKAMKRPIPQHEFKPDDAVEQAFRQGYTTGFNAAMSSICIIKQQNAQLLKENAILRAAIERRDTENNQDGWYE